jgi:hypothetical protein
LLAFTPPKINGCNARIGNDEDELVRQYFYRSGTWYRSPDGIGWQRDVNDWAELLLLEDTLEGDTTIVASLGTGGANGLAVYTGGDWRLQSGFFTTLANLQAFGELIVDGAVCSVEAVPGINGEGIRYQYDGAEWIRTAALTAGYAWALTLTQAVTGADPSGVGAVRAGDYGVYTPVSGTPIVYRYAPAVTVAAGAGGGTQAQWLPPEVYAGTVTIGAYLTGTENVTDNVVLNAQGWPTISRTNGSITSQTTRVRLATSGNNGLVSISALTADNVITPSTKVYMRFLMRAVVGNGSATASTNIGIPAFGDGSNYILGAYISAATSKELGLHLLELIKLRRPQSLALLTLMIWLKSSSILQKA